MKSIISNSQFCYICSRPKEEEHHIFGGSNHRPLSEKYGIKIPICRCCHEAITRPTNEFDKGLANWLHEIGQEKWEETYGTREDFIKIFKKSYL